MTGNGMLAVNLIGSLKRDTLMNASIIRTLRQVLATVEIYPVFNSDRDEDWGNLAVIAHEGPPLAFDPGAARRFPIHPSIFISHLFILSILLK
jgi:hypothetical protein